MRRRTVSLILFFVVIILVGYIFYSLLFVPMWQRNAELRDKLEKESIRLQTLIELSRFTPSLGVREELYKERLELLGKVLSPDTETPTFLVQMEQVAKTHGVTIVSISNPSPPVQADGNTISSFQMTVKGDYFKVLSFLRALYYFPRVVDVSAMSIDGSAEVSVKLDCTLFLKPGGGQ
ncbi:MAG: type 4a pilus biogenesis protein PilO [Caldiserica bacterium]|jgi:Tfp pilus assembly protein PilO|nr:type 4a pilus biogenesis protein PilO [Caldisericota bacterium]MDH7561872.1 type 4a pilus biogenesis protein PilO [Caldisericota bacterium]